MRLKGFRLIRLMLLGDARFSSQLGRVVPGRSARGSIGVIIGVILG